jgi:hypothetical protein
VIGFKPTTTHPRHRHTRSSPSPFFTKTIVIGKNGQPVYADQQQQYDTNHEKVKHVSSLQQQLSPSPVAFTSSNIGMNESILPTTTPLDFSNFIYPSYDSSNTGRLLAVETSGSFTESNQTTPTTQSSYTVAANTDGVAVMALPLMEPLDEIPEESKTKKKKNVVSNTKTDGNKKTRPSPRKGMVRREFQRRFLWFTNSRKSKKEDLQKLCSTMV